MFCAVDVKETVHQDHAHNTAKVIARRASPQLQEIMYLKAKTTPSKNPHSICSSPQQLIVPISVHKWQGKAIGDTGSSYTRMNISG